jgi:hypothetical protein
MTIRRRGGEQMKPGASNWQGRLAPGGRDARML